MFYLIVFLLQILKDEISVHEIFEISDLVEMDYPPKIEIDILSVPTSPDSALCLHVDGLNRRCVFKLLPGIANYNRSTLDIIVRNLSVCLQVIFQDKHNKSLWTPPR